MVVNLTIACFTNACIDIAFNRWDIATEVYELVLVTTFFVWLWDVCVFKKQIHNLFMVFRSTYQAIPLIVEL